MLATMRRISPAGLVVLLGASACYSSYYDPPTTPQWNPAIVSGPPGGAVDPGYGFQGEGQPEGQLEAQGQGQGPALAPGQPGYVAGYPAGCPAGTEDGAAQDPAAAG